MTDYYASCFQMDKIASEMRERYEKSSIDDAAKEISAALAQFSISLHREFADMIKHDNWLIQGANRAKLDLALIPNSAKPVVIRGRA